MGSPLKKKNGMNKFATKLRYHRIQTFKMMWPKAENNDWEKNCVLNYRCDRAHELSWPVASGGLSHHDRLWILTDLSITFRLMNSDSAKHIKPCQHLYLNFRFVVLKGICLFYFLFCYLFKDFRTENRHTCHKTILGFKFSYNLLLLWKLNTE